jgi:hypothetical protein
MLRKGRQGEVGGIQLRPRSRDGKVVKEFRGELDSFVLFDNVDSQAVDPFEFGCCSQTIARVRPSGKSTTRVQKAATPRCGPEMIGS